MYYLNVLILVLTLVGRILWTENNTAKHSLIVTIESPEPELLTWLNFYLSSVITQQGVAHQF